MRAIGYIRTSKGESLYNNKNKFEQLDEIKNHINSKGWELSDILYDEGYSGKSLKRPSLKSIGERASKGRFDVLIISSFDRLSIKQKDFCFFAKEIIEKNNIHFISIAEKIDTTLLKNNEILMILESFSKLQNDEIITSDTLKTLNTDDKKNNLGKTSYFNEDLKLIKYIQTLKKSGLSPDLIAEVLNHCNISTRKGQKWYSSTVNYVLKYSCVLEPAL